VPANFFTLAGTTYCVNSANSGVVQAQFVATEDPLILDTWNVADVSTFGAPTNPTVFSVAVQTLISYIDTYHFLAWGQPAGTVTLRHSDSTEYVIPMTTAGGTWQAYPNISIKAGNYTVIDSAPATWSNNPESNYAGFSRIRGRAA
jgi:hypothetical protein